jgi:uncharacterized protein (DUF1800 family)
MRRVKLALLAPLLLLSTGFGQNWGDFRTRVVTREHSEIIWEKKTAAHFARRAGFSASPKTLDRLISQGFDETLEEYLDSYGLDDAEMLAALEAQAYQLTYVNQNNQERPSWQNMSRWWLFRMVHSDRQLVEKMTYFWHDHFATSLAKVNVINLDHVPFMMVQNELFREHALGNFKHLVHDVARDPAMLFWLDNHLNIKDNPNENWARELLELFTMGIGNYTEQDIQEAARAFTGWTLDRQTQTFSFRPLLHDFGSKVFLGQSGPFGGDDIIDIVFDQPVTAEYIAEKLFEFFVYPSPSEEIVREMGDVFRESGYEIRPLLRAIFTHPEFFSGEAYRAQIKSPLELVVGTYRELGISDPQVLPWVMRNLGQELFRPPDVGGWTSGTGWLNTTTLLNRYNFFNYIATRRQGPDFFDVNSIIEEHQLTSSFDVVNHFLDRLVQDDVPMDTFFVLEDYLRRDDAGLSSDFDINDPLTVEKKVRGLVYLTLILSVYELG